MPGGVIDPDPCSVLLIVLLGVVVLAVWGLTRGGGNRALMIGLVVTLLLMFVLGGVIFIWREQQSRFLITVPPGTEYVGRVIVDGREHRISGDQTQAITYSGKRVELTVIPTRIDLTRTLTVSLNGGREVGSPHGAYVVNNRNSLLSGWGEQGAFDQDNWHRTAAELLPGHEDPSTAPATDQESPGGP